MKTIPQISLFHFCMSLPMCVLTFAFIFLQREVLSCIWFAVLLFAISVGMCIASIIIGRRNHLTKADMIINMLLPLIMVVLYLVSWPLNMCGDMIALVWFYGAFGILLAYFLYLCLGGHIYRGATYNVLFHSIMMLSMYFLL